MRSRHFLCNKFLSLCSMKVELFVIYNSCTTFFARQQNENFEKTELAETYNNFGFRFKSKRQLLYDCLGLNSGVLLTKEDEISLN